MSSATMSRRFGLPFGESAAIHWDGANANTAAKVEAEINERRNNMTATPGCSSLVAGEGEAEEEHLRERPNGLSEFRKP
jgi:hypothetical protein